MEKLFTSWIVVLVWIFSASFLKPLLNKEKSLKVYSNALGVTIYSIYFYRATKEQILPITFSLLNKSIATSELGFMGWFQPAANQEIVALIYFLAVDAITRLLTKHKFFHVVESKEDNYYKYLGDAVDHMATFLLVSITISLPFFVLALTGDYGLVVLPISAAVLSIVALGILRYDRLGWSSNK